MLYNVKCCNDGLISMLVIRILTAGWSNISERLGLHSPVGSQ